MAPNKIKGLRCQRMCFSNVYWDSLVIVSTGIMIVSLGQTPFGLCTHWPLFIVYAFIWLCLAVSNPEQILGHLLHTMHLKVHHYITKNPLPRIKSTGPGLLCLCFNSEEYGVLNWLWKRCVYLFENQCSVLSNLNANLFSNEHRHACNRLPNVFYSWLAH